VGCVLVRVIGCTFVGLVGLNGGEHDLSSTGIECIRLGWTRTVNVTAYVTV